MAHPEAPWVSELGLDRRARSELIIDQRDLDGEHVPAAHAHSIRRAWTTLSLDGVWCLGGRPVAYFKTFGDDTGAELSSFHRYVWNQSTTPLAVAITARSIYVFSAYTLPGASVDNANDTRAIQVLERAANALDARSFAIDVERGRTFANPKAFKPEHRADRYLLGNLLALRKRLISEADMAPRSAEQLLLQTVFLCYLNDRGLLNASHIGAADTFATFLADGAPSVARQRLIGLLRGLHREFNGDFFDADERGIPEGSISLLRRFLAGEVLDTGQAALGFWAYDFSAIPVEMLSEIYQAFLSDDFTADRRELGAYYTPRFLADVVLDTALNGQRLSAPSRFLDPACGSGIFLVAAFNRLIEDYRRTCRHQAPDPVQIRRLLVENIFGVDVSETACRIAALSLHLALLDQLLQADVRALGSRGTVLPKLLSDEDGHHNIDKADFFSLTADRWVHQFDYVIGNPPWVRISERERSPLLRWATENNVPIAQRQAANGFLFKALDHLRTSGVSCLLLPASLLLNQQERNLEVQRRLFSKANVTNIINLSDLCYLLFEDASRAPIIVRYSPGPASSSDTVEYAAVKADLPTLRAQVLAIDRDDIWVVQYAEILRDLKEPRALPTWKLRLWASPRDLKLLQRLSTYPALKERIIHRNGWVIGEGFNPNARGEVRDRPFLHEMPFLPSDRLKSYAVSSDALSDGPPTFAPRQSGDERIYRGPHLLIPRGAPRHQRRMRVAFSDKDCSFQHAIRAIAAPSEDADELRLIACILCSPLITYYLFHTSASWGIERAQVHRSEYEALPYPPPSGPRKNIARQIVALHRKIGQVLDQEGYGSRFDELAAAIDAYVADYYELEESELALIEDTLNISLPSATPTSTVAQTPASRRASGEEREVYVHELLSAFAWMNVPPRVRLRAISARMDLAVLQLSLVRKPGLMPAVVAESESPPALQKVLDRLGKILPESTGSVLRQRDLKVFAGEDLFLIKDLAKRHWSRSAALNDADEIVAAVAATGEG